MISQRVIAALERVDQTEADEQEMRLRQALANLVAAAEKASAEIKSQHQMWPGEVDDLADALSELDERLKECE